MLSYYNRKNGQTMPLLMSLSGCVAIANRKRKEKKKNIIIPLGDASTRVSGSRRFVPAERRLRSKWLAIGQVPPMLTALDASSGPCLVRRFGCSGWWY